MATSFPAWGQTLKSARRFLLASVSIPAVIVGTIAALPKDLAYAAPGRFALTIAVFAVALAGLIGFSWSRRRYREQAMLWRYGGASSAVRDSLTFLKTERALAARGQLTASAGAVAALSLHVLAHWPQAAVLAPYRSALGFLTIGLLALIPVCALRNRGNYVNAYFLRHRYIPQQVGHLRYRAPRRSRWSRRRATSRVVTVTGPGRFSINGFEWSFRDLANVICVGQTGSGKTLTVLNSLLEGLIASFANTPLKIGGLVLDVKGDFNEKIQALCARYKRVDDLVVLDPSMWAESGGTAHSIAWNPLDNNDDALEVATRLIAALRLIGLEQGNEGSFFLDSARVFLTHAVTVVRAAAITPAPSIINVYRLSQEGEETTPLYHELIAAIAARYPDQVPVEITDAIAFFEQTWAHTADRQKSGVRGTLTQLLDEFLVPPFRDIFTQPSTFSMADIVDQSKLLYVHMPASDRERMSRLVSTLIKLEYQKVVLKRVKKSQPTFLVADEYQALHTSNDPAFFERSRESNHTSIISTQNLSALYRISSNNVYAIKNLIGNCAVKIWLRQSEEETTRFASALCGTRSEVIVTTSEQASIDGGWSKRRHTSYGRSTRTLPRFPAEAFTRLAVPVQGDASATSAESIVHLGSLADAKVQELVWPINPLR